MQYYSAMLLCRPPLTSYFDTALHFLVSSYDYSLLVELAGNITIIAKYDIRKYDWLIVDIFTVSSVCRFG